MRDMTKKQFANALARHGMRSEGFLGYIDLGIEGEHISVSRFNAGNNRRAQLAYLLAQRDKWERKLEGEGAEKESA